MGKLNNLAIAKAIKAPGKYQDGDGLHLVVSAPGSASWMLRLQHEGRRRDHGLGSLKQLTLAQAREKALLYRSMIKAGIDPKAERAKIASIPTFEEAARTLHANLAPTWRNGKHASQWLRTVDLYAFKKIGAAKVDSITAGNIHEVLLPAWVKTPETGRRLAQRIGAILDWAYSGLPRARGADAVGTKGPSPT